MISAREAQRIRADPHRNPQNEAISDGRRRDGTTGNGRAASACRRHRSSTPKHRVGACTPQSSGRQVVLAQPTMPSRGFGAGSGRFPRCRVFLRAHAAGAQVRTATTLFA